VATGVSLLCIGWSLDRSPHRAIAGLVYFFGAALLLEETYGWLRREPLEILFLGAACGVVVLAGVARSRSLLVVGTAALVGYIADFIYRHFADNLGAPLALMAIGLVFLGLGAAAVRINAQYADAARAKRGLVGTALAKRGLASLDKMSSPFSWRFRLCLPLLTLPSPPICAPAISNAWKTSAS
jgi:hypothetical protein